MAEFKKFEVEIGSNGHIKLKGKLIAILAAWNKFEDLSPPTKRRPVKWKYALNVKKKNQMPNLLKQVCIGIQCVIHVEKNIKESITKS